MAQRSLLERRARFVVLPALLLLAVGAVGARAMPPPDDGKVDARLLTTLQAGETVHVVVLLREPASRKAPHIDLPTLRREISEVQTEVLDAVEPRQFIVTRRFRAVAGLAGRVTLAGIEQLRRHPAVIRIDADSGGTGGLAQSVPLIHADLWHDNGVTGDGVVVAVIDSGIDTDHADLADSLIHQECFGDNNDAIDGVGFCPNGSDRQSGPGSAEDEFGHGTHVSGIITSNGTVSSVGVAPGAQIVAIKVLDRFNRFYGFSEIVAALDYIITDRPDVQLINMSLYTDALFRGACDHSTSYNQLGAAAVDTLRAMGVATFAISGNSGDSSEMGSPGCLSQVVSVGAVDKTDVIPPWSNSNSTLDLLAPGVNITSAYLFNGTTTFSGTSMASPHAAGCAALFIQGGEAATPDQIEARLKYSPVHITDNRNKLTFPRIDCAPIGIADTAAVPASVGGGDVMITTSAGALSNTIGVNPALLPGTPNRIEFPHGLFGFTISGLTPGETVTVTLTFPAPLPDNAQWYWYNHSSFTWTTITNTVVWSGTAAYLSVTDGGTGDTDGVANGVIVDPIGPAAPVVTPPPSSPPPTPGNESGGGGGCDLASSRTPPSDSNLAHLLVLAAPAALVIVRRQLRRGNAFRS